MLGKEIKKFSNENAKVRKAEQNCYELGNKLQNLQIAYERMKQILEEKYRETHGLKEDLEKMRKEKQEVLLRLVVLLW